MNSEISSPEKNDDNKELYIYSQNMGRFYQEDELIKYKSYHKRFKLSGQKSDDKMDWRSKLEYSKDKKNKFENYNNLRTIEKKKAIPSYGIILFTINENTNELLYQLCQRRDSISYAEFIKDKLPIENIPMHINLMSKEERKRCVDYYKKKDAESIWNDLWINHKNKIYKNEMKRCCDSFIVNMEKYIDFFLDETKGRDENPWGFAKGRKHDSETEISCALREFEEETTIPKNLIQLLHIKPYEELYMGTDDKLYKTIYYAACIPYCYVTELQNLVPNTENIIRTSYVSEEVADIKWFPYLTALNKVDIHKQNILRQINQTLLFTKRQIPLRRHSI